MNLYLALTHAPRYVLIPHALGYPYRLCSYYYLQGSKRDVIESLLETAKDGSEWIMDSGLFSLMFGGAQGTLRTYDDYKRYAVTYVENMLRWGWKHPIVECDVQRVLGADACERLRDEVFRPSGLPVIYVWHIPETLDGLRRLAAREARIALSVPELRHTHAGGSFLGGLQVKQVLLGLLREIRTVNPHAKVHLLGNTEAGLMRLPATSCDSSSWTSGGRWGNGLYYNPQTKMLKQVSVRSPRWAAWVTWCETHFAQSFDLLRPLWATPHQVVYYTNAVCGAISMWLLMESNGITRRGPGVPPALCWKL